MPLIIMGAGSVGGYIGGRLHASGTNVHFIGRPAFASAASSHGMHLSDLYGAHLHLPNSQLSIDTKPDAIQHADIIILTVKSSDTTATATAFAQYLRPNAVIISLQNGLKNAELLQAALPTHDIISGMVPFNIVRPRETHFHQASEGVIQLSKHPAAYGLVQKLKGAGLNATITEDIHAVQWAKLLLNLNNAINALSGLPLREELSDRAFRRVLAAAQQEAIDLLHLRGQSLARLTPLPAHWLPRLLDTPNVLFMRAAQRMLAIDPLARSSMQDDLRAGRKTEIDVLQGEIIRLAEAYGRQAPVNQALHALIRRAENGDNKQWQGHELLQHITAEKMRAR